MTDQTPALMRCPFCGAKPHQGPGKVEHCQLHGEPYQNYGVWCPHGCAKKTGGDKNQAIAAWNTRAPAIPADVEAMAQMLDGIASEAATACGAAAEYPPDTNRLVERVIEPMLEAAAALTAQAARIAALEAERDEAILRRNLFREDVETLRRRLARALADNGLLREALADDRTFLSVLHGDVAKTEKTDPRWDGMTAVVLRQKAKVDAALADPASDAGEGE